MTTEEQEFYTNVGAFLRRTREAQGLSFQDVADALEISKPFIQHIEAGDKKISLFRLSQVMQVLNVSFVGFDADLSIKGMREL